MGHEIIIFIDKITYFVVNFMHLKFMKTVFLALFLTLALSGCQSASQVEQEKMERAIVELNKKNYDSAIILLKDLPETPQVRDLLASSYAGKGGFNALALYDKVVDIKLSTLYRLSDVYQESNLKNLDIALSYIHPGTIPEPDLMPNSSNVKYASIQVYKASQLLLKNYFARPLSPNDTCRAVETLYRDIRVIIVSINKAVYSLKNIEPEIYQDIKSVQGSLNVSENFYEESVIGDQDIKKAKTELGKLYQDYIGKVPDQCDE